MKHAYRITREDSSGAPDYATSSNEDVANLRGHIERICNEILKRFDTDGMQKAVITVERIVVDD